MIAKLMSRFDPKTIGRVGRLQRIQLINSELKKLRRDWSATNDPITRMSIELRAKTYKRQLAVNLRYYKEEQLFYFENNPLGKRVVRALL